MDIKEFSEELQHLLETNKAQKFEIELYKKQLIIILINNGGILENLKYDNMSEIDLEKILLEIGYSCCLISNIVTEKSIKEWKDVPKKITTKI